MAEAPFVNGQARIAAAFRRSSISSFLPAAHQGRTPMDDDARSHSIAATIGGGRKMIDPAPAYDDHGRAFSDATLGEAYLKRRSAASMPHGWPLICKLRTDCKLRLSPAMRDSARQEMLAEPAGRGITTPGRRRSSYGPHGDQRGGSQDPRPISFVTPPVCSGNFRSTFIGIKAGYEPVAISPVSTGQTVDGYYFLEWDRPRRRLRSRLRWVSAQE